MALQAAQVQTLETSPRQAEEGAYATEVHFYVSRAIKVLGLPRLKMMVSRW